MSAPVVCEPLTALAPDHPPLAEHAVTLLADQVSVAALPALMVLGAALKVTTGANPATVTVADCEAEPPGPVQVSAYSVVLVSFPVDHVPLVATPPLQPPEAVHAVTFPALQLKADVPPLATVVGDAVNVTEGAAFTTTPADCEPVTAGIAVLLPTESVGVLWTDADAPQAASADNAAYTSTQRNICDARQARHAWE